MFAWRYKLLSDVRPVKRHERWKAMKTWIRVFAYKLVVKIFVCIPGRIPGTFVRVVVQILIEKKV